MFRIVGGQAIVPGPGKGLDSGRFDDHILAPTQPVPWEDFTAWDLVLLLLYRERVFIRT